MLQLYDLAGLYYRAFHALPTSMRGPDGSPNNAIRGTLDMLARVIEAAHPTHVAACLDVDWRPAWRVALVPSYKAHRVAVSEALGAPGSSGSAVEDVPDELARQVPALLDLLRAAGIPLAGAAGAEADDVAATLCARRGDEPVEVVSGDRDLFQLIRPGPAEVTVRYIGGGMAKAFVLDADGLAARYGVDGPGYATMATLRGDPSDGLPGVAGIGEKTATVLTRSYGTVQAIMAAAADPSSPMSAATRRRILDAADYLRAAVGVVRTRADATVHVDGTVGDRIGPLTERRVDPGVLRERAAAAGVERSLAHLVAALER